MSAKPVAKKRVRKRRASVTTPAPVPAVTTPIVVANQNLLWNAIITAIVTLGLAWIGLQQKFAEEHAANSRAEAESSRERIEAMQAEQGKTMTTVKKNTDGAITAALLVAADATRKAAEKSKDPEDIDIADKAQKAYETQKAIIEGEPKSSPP